MESCLAKIRDDLYSLRFSGSLRGLAAIDDETAKLLDMEKLREIVVSCESYVSSVNALISKLHRMKPNLKDRLMKTDFQNKVNSTISEIEEKLNTIPIDELGLIINQKVQATKVKFTHRFKGFNFNF